MNTLADRLTEALNASGKTQADLARHVGVKPPSVNGWFSGKTKSLKGTSLIRAAAFLGVRDVWLSEGRGSMFPANSSSAQSSLDQPAADLWSKYLRANASHQLLAELALLRSNDAWPSWVPASLKSSINTAISIIEEQMPRNHSAVSS